MGFWGTWGGALSVKGGVLPEHLLLRFLHRMDSLVLTDLLDSCLWLRSLIWYSRDGTCMGGVLEV